MDWNILKNTKRIITHANCPDGMASAIILYSVFPTIEPEFYSYNDFDYLNLKAEKGMLFCDITPPKHRYEEFVEVDAIVLDHHKGAEKIVKSFKNGIFADEIEEPGVSGAYLAWREVYTSKYRSNDSAKKFAELAGVRDTWQINHPDFISSCWQAIMLQFYSWEYWKKKYWKDLSFDFSFFNEMDTGRSLFEKRQKDVNNCVKNSLIFSINNLKVAVFNDPDKLCSDVAEIHRKNGVDIIAGFYYSNKNKSISLNWSLRSNDNFNVQKLATYMGGGGHAKAAGFTVNDENERNPFIYINDILRSYINETEL